MVPLIISVPFLHAFGFFGVSVPLLIGTLAVTYVLSVNRFRLNLHFSGADCFLLVPLILGLICLDYPSIQPMNFYHSMLWFVTVLIFYFGTKIVVINSKVNVRQLGSAFFLALCVASVGVISDFVAVNYYGFYLSDIFPYQIGTMEPTTNFSNALFRARGFAAEPGFTAMVYEFLLPLGLLYCFRRRQSLILIPPILFGYFILTSGASLVGLLICSCLFAFGSTKKIFVTVGFVGVISVLFWEQVYFYFVQSIGPKVLIVLSGESTRVQVLESLLPVLVENPIGIGFGTLSYEFERDGYFGLHRLVGGGALNLYLEVALISGVVGLISFILFLVSIFYRSYQLDGSGELLALRFSLLWLLIHQLFLTEYYFPMLWINLALIATFGYVQSRSVSLCRSGVAS